MTCALLCAFFSALSCVLSCAFFSTLRCVLSFAVLVNIIPSCHVMSCAALYHPVMTYHGNRLWGLEGVDTESEESINPAYNLGPESWILGAMTRAVFSIKNNSQLA
jgi:hypothetical protein